LRNIEDFHMHVHIACQCSHIRKQLAKANKGKWDYRIFLNEKNGNYEEI
jgi:CDP-diacylglycerol pyrophosphatase